MRVYNLSSVCAIKKMLDGRTANMRDSVEQVPIPIPLLTSVVPFNQFHSMNSTSLQLKLPTSPPLTMKSSPIRIAVLEADVPINYTRIKYGSYGAVFTSLLHKAADASNLPREKLEITGWDVINEEAAKDGEWEEMGGEWNWKRRKGYPKMEDMDAVLITGSRMWVPCLHVGSYERKNSDAILRKVEARY